ncbi:hypothetical protein HYV30_04300 [Candidatus Kaiserbacteria bacterium]|nr:hypothetical protein [Candidatus Kaiserbacteria bacterium]
MYGEPSIWAKLVEAEMLKAETLGVVIRLGDRSSREKAPKQYLEQFAPVPVYYLDEEAGRGGRLGFEPDDGTTIRIVMKKIGRLGDLRDTDLWFCSRSAVPHTVPEVRRYLETEMSPGKKFDNDTVVTLYGIEYLPKETPAADGPGAEVKPDTTSGVAFDLGLFGDRKF